MLFDWLHDHMPHLILGIILLVLILLIKMAVNEKLVEKQFMKDCMADNKKHYECLAIWRAGEPEVIPVYIPMSR